MQLFAQDYSTLIHNISYSVISIALVLIPQSVGVLIACSYIGKTITQIGTKWVMIVNSRFYL
jgi:ABC-type multidrug transport system permease subunit